MMRELSYWVGEIEKEFKKCKDFGISNECDVIREFLTYFDFLIHIAKKRNFVRKVALVCAIVDLREVIILYVVKYKELNDEDRKRISGMIMEMIFCLKKMIENIDNIVMFRKYDEMFVEKRRRLFLLYGSVFGWDD